MKKPYFSPRQEENALALSVVHEGVAPDVALGWAVRTRDGWELGAGRAHAETSDFSSSSAAPIFDLASVTKPMTALAFALAMTTTTKLRRGTHLEHVLEEARGTRSADVPIELLLAHRAGLLAHVDLFAPLMEGRPVDRTAMLQQAANARSPSSAPVYSDLGYLLAGEALARGTETRDAGEAIETLVVSRLGLSDELGTARSFRANPNVDFDKRVRPTEDVAWRGGVIRGAVHDENAWAFSRDGGSGHAGMFGTVNAVLRFGCFAHDAIFDSGNGNPDLSWLVRERPGGTLRAGFDGKSEEGSSAGKRAGPRTFGHLGFTGTSLWIDPDARAVVALLTNRVHPTRENIAIRAARPRVHDALFEIAAAARKL